MGFYSQTSFIFESSLKSLNFTNFRSHCSLTKKPCSIIALFYQIFLFQNFMEVGVIYIRPFSIQKETSKIYIQKILTIEIVRNCWSSANLFLDHAIDNKYVVILLQLVKRRRRHQLVRCQTVFHLVLLFSLVNHSLLLTAIL